VADMFFKWCFRNLFYHLSPLISELSFQYIVKQSLAKKAERKIVLLQLLK
jgi:hypothetical protein